MRLLHLTSWWPSGPRDHAGSFVVDQVEALQARHEVKVNRIEGDRWTGVLGGLASGARWVLEHQTWSQVVERFRPDLIHAHVTWPAGWIAVRLGAEWRVPVVISEYLVPFRSCLKTPLHTQRVKEALERAAVVTACGPGLVNQMRRFTDRNIEVVNPIVADEFHGHRDPLRDPQLILCVGSLTERKDFGLALEVLRRLPGYRMVIVGQGPLGTYLMQRASVLGVRDRVTFIPWLLRGELASLMGRAACVLVTSHDEGFSLVAAEATTMGVPVVAKACGGPEHFLPGRRVSWSGWPGDLVGLVKGAVDADVARDYRWHRERYLERIETVYARAFQRMPVPLEAQGAA